MDQSDLDELDFDPASFAHIRNKNEDRVVALLPAVLRDYPGFGVTRHDLEDIYACALNKLTARYSLPASGSQFPDPVSDEAIRDAIEGAIITVILRPRGESRDTQIIMAETAARRQHGE